MGEMPTACPNPSAYGKVRLSHLHLPLSHLPAQDRKTHHYPHIEHPPSPHVASDAKERALYSPLDHGACLCSQQPLSTEVWNKAVAMYTK